MTHPRLSVSEMCTYPLAVRRRARALGRARRPPGRRDHRQARRLRARRGRRRPARAVDGGHDGDHRLLRPLGSGDAGTTTRAQINDAIDLAAEIGGCTYFTPGRRDGRSFDELTASLAEAVAPCAAYAAIPGCPARDRAVAAHRRVVRAHPARRPRRRRGRRHRRDRRPRQLLDGARLREDRPPRRCPDRRRPVRRRRVRHARRNRRRAAGPFPATATCRSTSSSRAALDAGYRGAFELEMVGPEDRGRGSRGRRCGVPSSARQRAAGSRSCREPGHRLQRRRDLGDARPAGARPPARRRGAAGRGDGPVPQRHRPLPRPRPHVVGRRVPVDRRSRDRRADREDHPAAAEEWGVNEGDRVAVRELVVTPDGLPDLRPRLLGRRGLGPLRRVRRAPRAAARIDGLPPPRGPPGRGAHRLRAAELRGHLGGARSSRTTSWSSRAPATWAWRPSSPPAPPAPRRSS